MIRYSTAWIGLFALILFATAPVIAQDHTPVDLPEQNDPIDIPYEKFVLDNGLTLIVHEDHKAPIAAVNVWYHVGSKNEKVGKTGFAHLFEHLMFNGSENYDDDYFQVLERAGATDLNGTTNRDRTNYFQNVPVNALDQVLWMESDRMGHLLGAIDQEKLDEQRGVVQNEKRQGENQPYGKAWGTIAANTYPQGHPYSWSVIGSMDDLNAASLDDVHEWFQNYYGTANAVIAVAGDVDPQDIKARVEKYFGDIPSGPPVAKHDAWIAKREGTHRMQMEDRVPQARIYKVWNVPEEGNPETDYLNLFSDILSSGKTSRLYKRLVYEEQVATSVFAGLNTGEIGSQFLIITTARPDADLAQVEALVDEELNRLIAEGPNERELERVKTDFIANFVRGIERIGGFGGKSDILARNEVYQSSPNAFKPTLRRVRQAAPNDLKMTAEKWLTDGQFVLEVHPFPEYNTAEAVAERTTLPEAGSPPPAVFPALQQVTLSNGMEVVLAERHAVPLVNFSLLVDAGYVADQGGILGTSTLALNMMDEGTKTRSSLDISEALTLLGAELNTSSNLDYSVVSLSALKENLDASLDLFSDVVLNPSFPEHELDRLKQEQLALIQRERVTPVQMALRVFPKLLYGEGHPYAAPFTGSGTEASVQAITRQTLTDFHSDWFKPNNAVMVVAGDITMQELTDKLEAQFGDWKKGAVQSKTLKTVDHQAASQVYLIDRPGSEQSIIFAGHVAPPKANPNEIAIETMNTVLGGAFTSRINMNLREDKGWSYGAFTFMPDARGQRPFIAYAPVQTDKTKASMQEVLAELNGILTTNPITAEELNKAKANQTLSLPGRWETIGAVGGSVNEIIRYGLDENYYQTYASAVNGLNLDAVTQAAKEVVHPDKLVWVVVGDRERIEAGIRELNLGPVQIIDADGNPI